LSSALGVSAKAQRAEEQERGAQAEIRVEQRLSRLTLLSAVDDRLREKLGHVNDHEDLDSVTPDRQGDQNDEQHPSHKDLLIARPKACCASRTYG